MQGSDSKVNNTYSTWRKSWVDTTRGVAMLAIVLFHTEVYFSGDTIIDYNLYVENALMVFFFLSGYLFYKEGNSFDIRKKLISIVRFIIVPYFIFSIIMAVPKALAHDEAILLKNIFLDIILGHASWFITSLAIAEIIFSFLIYITQKSWIGILPIISLLLGVIPFFINRQFLCFWFTNVALMSLIFLCIGYLYHLKEEQLSKYINLRLCIPMLIAVIVLKVFEQKYSMNMVVYPSTITSPATFFCDCIISSLLLITFFHRFNSCNFINFVGRNSLFFYFLCGGVPSLMGKFLRFIGINYNGNYLLVLLAFILSVTIISFLSIIVNKYFPFLLGRSKEEIKKIYS
ncbi:MAG: acyltransferase [Prevotella sp.]|nr:acyltransferase [Prevotella sp.]